MHCSSAWLASAEDFRNCQVNTSARIAEAMRLLLLSHFNVLALLLLLLLQCWDCARPSGKQRQRTQQMQQRQRRQRRRSWERHPAMALALRQMQA
jgi:hypothetical protein